MSKDEILFDDEYELKYLLSQYELPLYVKKPSWYGVFYFKISGNNEKMAEGQRYSNDNYYDDYSCSITDVFCLYGEKNIKKSKKYKNKDSINLNPNNLDLNKNHYIKGETRLFICKNNNVDEVVFDSFENKGKGDLIYVIKNGERQFYSFPSTYVFNNKDDVRLSLLLKT